MAELIDEFLEDGHDRMHKSVEATRNELSTVRTGRASPALLDRIEVDYYGAPTPLKQLAQVNATDVHLLTLTPYDKSSVSMIEKAIMESDLGLTPNNDGNVIRLQIPELTEERRKELVRVIHGVCEEGRVAVRNIRRDVMHDLRELKKEGEVGEDEERRAESSLQKETDKAVEEIDAPDEVEGRGAEGARAASDRGKGCGKWIALSPPRGREAEQPAVIRYVAIITDGNGRWAQQRGEAPIEGHRAGADVVKARLRDAVELGIEELTVFSFSTENWSRPREEVEGLMAMFAERIDRETPELHEEGVRMRFIGRREGLDAGLVERIEWAEDKTAGNDRITLFVCFNYGGRAEIVDAARAFDGETEEEFRAHLYAPDMHDPDLLIRTSGEQRISNYLLWQCAYSEFVFRDELWPDFTREAFQAALDEFSARRRRFGNR